MTLKKSPLPNQKSSRQKSSRQKSAPEISPPQADSLQTVKRLLHQTRFFTSANSLAQLPESRSEIAFAGRSNAGKSSALNSITSQKNLARTSKTPGRTQLINYFAVGEQCFLVDLPGYGYAKVPESIRLHWQTILQRYFETRTALHLLIMLVDARHSLTALDKQMLSWCEFKNLPTHLLLTKADKLTRNEGNKRLELAKKELASFTMPLTYQLFSSTKPEIGLNELYHHLASWLAPPTQRLAHNEITESTPTISSPSSTTET